MFWTIFLDYFFHNDIESLFDKINFTKSKWFLPGTYHQPSQSDQYYYEKKIDMYGNYEKFLLAGDFNEEISHHHLETFLYQHELKSPSKEKTCFKYLLNRSFLNPIIVLFKILKQ